MTETVFVAPYTSNRESFHTEPDCRWVDDSYAEIDRARAETTLRECSYCAGEATFANNPNHDYYQYALEHE